MQQTLSTRANKPRDLFPWRRYSFFLLPSPFALRPRESGITIRREKRQRKIRSKESFIERKTRVAGGSSSNDGRDAYSRVGIDGTSFSTKYTTLYFLLVHANSVYPTLCSDVLSLFRATTLCFR